ncbi:MAG: hypothetical protein BME93_02580 [Methanosarcinales archaeon Met12]|nr:MAG: hypothetical protein BME93_02580 [Methanosarcinales archaeon Met12]
MPIPVRLKIIPATIKTAPVAFLIGLKERENNPPINNNNISNSNSVEPIIKFTSCAL